MNLANLKGLEIGWQLAVLRRKPENERVCPVCGKSFRIDGSRLARVKGLICCSRKCKAISQKGRLIDGFNRKLKRGTKKICPTCGQQFQPPPSLNDRTHCSHTCRVANRASFDGLRGENHYNWKGGVAKRNRESMAWWRTQVFKRDGFQCQICAYRGKGLNAHHLKHWADFPTLRFEISNGVTLCQPCHFFLHWLGRKIIRETNRQMKTESGHYYTKTGEPMHFVPRKNGGGNRPTTVGDARKLGLLPSPTTILKTLSKPNLTEWLIRNAVAAVVTTPDIPGEGLDAKITRVLDHEKQQDQERDAAADEGTAIHNALQLSLEGLEYDPKYRPHVEAVRREIDPLGRAIKTETVLVGDGYAGRTDAVLEDDHTISVLDFKGCNKLPDKPWPEAVMQVSSYSAALGNTGDKLVRGLIVYINRNIVGEVRAFAVDDWQSEYEKFKLLLRYWYAANNIPFPTP